MRFGSHDTATGLLAICPGRRGANVLQNVPSHVA
jgi:hypothetical protein